MTSLSVTDVADDDSANLRTLRATRCGTSRLPSTDLSPPTVNSSVATTNVIRSLATAEMARVGGHYSVQRHSRSLILVQIESSYVICIVIE